MATSVYRRRSRDYQSLGDNDKVYNHEYITETHEMHSVNDQPGPKQTDSISHDVRWHGIPNPFTYVWRQTIEDLNLIGWRTILDRTYNHVLPNLVMLSLLAIILFLVLVQPVNLDQSLCRPDGSPIYRGSNSSDWKQYDPWDTSETFTINMGFGKLPFGQAKLIDVIWDTVFGRGGQALMAIISYRVLTSALSLLMEQEPVPFGVFEAVTLEGITMTSMQKLVRDFRKNKSARSQVLILFMIISIILALIFPTLASAMTGYSANFDAQISLPDNVTVPASSLQRVWYVIHDGSRLGQGFYDGYAVVDRSDGEPQLYNSYMYPHLNYSTAQAWEKSRSSWMSDCWQTAPGKVDAAGNITLTNVVGATPDCQRLWDISNYTNTYGLLGSQNVSSSFYNSVEQREISIGTPVLNISMYLPYALWYYRLSLRKAFQSSNLSWSVVPYGVTWYLGRNTTIAGNYTEMLYAYRDYDSSTVLTVTDIQDGLKCRQQSPGTDTVVQYQWGFSFQPLLTFTVLLLFWTAIIYGMHVRVRRHSRLRQQHRTLGLRRAVLDLASNYQEHLTDQGTSMCNETQLKRLVHGGTISYASLLISDVSLTQSQRCRLWWKRFKFGKWAKSEWKWLTFLLLLVLLTPVGLLTPAYIAFYPIFFPVPFLGIVVVLAAGRKHFSRWLLFVPFALTFWGLQIWFTLWILRS